MNFQLVQKIANAILYEGYMLYPYTPSALKNQKRFNFGVLAPRGYSEAQLGTEAWSMQTECLVIGHERTTFDVRVRFLHLLAREVATVNGSFSEWAESGTPEFRIVESLEVDDQLLQAFQEAVEREIKVPSFCLGELISKPMRLSFSFPESLEAEPLRDTGGQIKGVLVRQQQSVEGAIEISAEMPEEQLYRMTVRILNLTPYGDAQQACRTEALSYSLVSAHTILGVSEGEFISLLEPPEEFREVAADCRNIGTWPVLVGEAGERDLLFSSPIILYDYPQVAPESMGDLFDGAEIDEILTLRIMTLTEREKREMQQVEAARQILERVEALTPEQLMKLHGTCRSVRSLDQDNNERVGMASAGRPDSA